MVIFAILSEFTLSTKRKSEKMNSFFTSAFIILSILSGYATIFFTNKAFDDFALWIALIIGMPIVILGIIAQIIFSVLIYHSVAKTTEEQE